MTAAWYIRSDYNYLRKNRKTLMKKIGIIGAMELEVETLKAHMTTTKITTKATWNFTKAH